MGMSATQARLLQLTAELNDLEYQGQQINNARTQLSTESATYYNQLLNMEVPTAPNKTDYTNTVYTFSYSTGGSTTERTITNIGLLDTEGNAIVTTQYTGTGSTVSASGDQGEVVATTEKVLDESQGAVMVSNLNDLYTEAGYTAVAVAQTYTEGATYVDKTGATVDVASAVASEMATGNYIGSDGKELTSYTIPMYTKGAQKTEMVDDTSSPIYDDEGNITGYEQIEQAIDEWELGSAVSEKEFFSSLNLGTVYQVVSDSEATAYIGSAATNVTSYTVNGKSVLTADELPETDEATNVKQAIEQSGYNADDFYFISDGNGGYVLYLKQDVEDGNSTAEAYDVAITDSALYTEDLTGTLEFSDSGRISSITIGGVTMAVTTTTELDEYAYDQAYEEYNYEKTIYDEEQSWINAQLSVIQTQDKRLELQLETLDTERSQITTEIDSLETVMGDNVERTYKTFSG